MAQNDNALSAVNKLKGFGGLLAVIGIAGTVFALVNPATQKAGFQYYLLAYVFWISLSLGCFAASLLHYTIRGSWGLPVLRVWEAGAKTLLPMLVLFIPIVLGMNHLYEWMHADVVANDRILQHKRPFLNIGTYLAVTGVCFAFWLFYTFRLSASSVKEDETKDPNLAQSRTNWSAFGLVLFVLSITFAFTAWTMSLTPHWFSSIYGVIFIVGQGLAALAFAVIMMNTLSKYRPFSSLVTIDHYHDLGKLMLAFVMLWAYMNLSQFLIIWSGDLPEENIHYFVRSQNGWQWFGFGMLVFHFFVPFLILLWGREVKRNPARLTVMAVYILIVRAIDIYWTVAPSLEAYHHEVSIVPHWSLLFTFLGIGGVWLFSFAMFLASKPLVPTHDPRLREVSLKEAYDHV